jgi:Fe-S-cluster containining protein
MSEQSYIPTCCLDIELEPLQLIFPERTDADWREFIDARGLDITFFGDLIKGAVDMGNGKVRIYHRCRMLLDDGRCGIYETRPQICRDFDCSRRGDCPCRGSGKPWQPTSVGN